MVAAAISALIAFSGCQKKTPEQIAKENSALLESAVKKAQTLLLEEKAGEAVELLEKSSESYGVSASLCEALAYAYLQNGKKAEAGIFFEKASDLKGGDGEMLFSAARVYEETGSSDSAINAYEKYLKIKPLDPVAWKALAKVLKSKGKNQEALNAYLASVKNAGRNPNSQEAAEIGVLFSEVGNNHQARRWLEASYAAAAPNNLETRKTALSALVGISLKEKNMESLKREVADLDKIDPSILDKEHPGLRQQMEKFERDLAEAQLKIKKMQEEKAAAEKKAKEEKELADKRAKEEIERVKKLAEERAEAEKREKEALQKEEKESSEKEQALKEEEKETPEMRSEKLVKETYEHIEKGDAVSAKRSANLAVFENGRSSDAWRALAKSYEASGERKAAYLAANEALYRNPDDIDATLFYLRSASFVVSNEKLLNMLYSAREKFPQNPEIMLGLARTYNVKGDTLNAKYFYNMFMDGTPKEHPLYEEVEKEFAEMLDPSSKKSGESLPSAADALVLPEKTGH